MSGKIVVCRCEDVTLEDVEHAIEVGYRDIEEVKRYTGFGTGPCQGKECLASIAAVIAERTGADPATIAAFTSRPPLAPTPLRFFAGDDRGGSDRDRGGSDRDRDPDRGAEP